jgi:hypothetical protein
MELGEKCHSDYGGILLEWKGDRKPGDLEVGQSFYLSTTHQSLVLFPNYSLNNRSLRVGEGFGPE